MSIYMYLYFSLCVYICTHKCTNKCIHVLIYTYTCICINMYITGFPGGSMVKYLLANTRDTGDTGSVSASGRSPGGRNGKPLQYSCLENPMDWEAWWATVHEVAKRLDWVSMHAHIYMCSKKMEEKWKKLSLNPMWPGTVRTDNKKEKS